MAKLTKNDIKNLESLYDKLENNKKIEYDDLTPNLSDFADWVIKNESYARELADTKFAFWGGWNALMSAYDFIAKTEKPPKLSHNSKAKVYEEDFIMLIYEKVLDGEWQ